MKRAPLGALLAFAALSSTACSRAPRTTAPSIEASAKPAETKPHERVADAASAGDGAPAAAQKESPFAVVAAYDSSKTSVKLFRLARGTLAVEVGVSVAVEVGVGAEEDHSAWIARSLLPSGDMPILDRVFTPTLEPKDDPFDVQGLDADDLWLTLNTNANPPTAGGGGTYVNRLREKASGSLATHYAGVGEWLEGRTVALRWRGFIGYLVPEGHEKPRALEILSGTKVPLPPVPKGAALVDVAVFPSGTIYALGFEGEHLGVAWELWKLAPGKAPEKANLHERGESSGQWSFIRGASEGDFMARRADDKGTTFVAWGDTVHSATVPFAAYEVASSREGTLWVPGELGLVRVPRAPRADQAALPLETVPLPSPERLKSLGVQCERIHGASAVVAETDANVWVTAECSCREKCWKTLLLHTQAQGAVLTPPLPHEVRKAKMPAKRNAKSGTPR